MKTSATLRTQANRPATSSATERQGPDVLQRPELPWTASTPVHFDDTSQAWIVCSYANVESVLLRTADFSWEVWDRRIDPVFAGMWNADGQRHAALRRLSQRYFQARRVNSMSSIIEDIVNDLVDDILLPGTGEVDVVNQISNRLGGRLMSAMVGLDFADVPRLITWRRAQQAAINEGRSPAIPEMWSYFEDLIERRRRKPEGGLLDYLIAAQQEGYQIEGAPLSDWDLIGSVWTVVTSGLTGANVGYTLVNLAAHQLLQQARHEPEVAWGAVNESLRLYPGIPVMRVRARRDIALGGVLISSGDLVHACISTANMDPGHFPEPERFDVTRTPSRHLSFGRGSHHCLGAQLFSIEVLTAVRVVLERLPNLRLHADKPLKHRYGAMFGTLLEAHFQFDTPGPRGTGHTAPAHAVPVGG
ncbi:cytochrome P450 [Streptomyces sp. BK340]|uniref:cytochrome P450 n=1 Tax=Streptomyces sp. BK340 TaxID=2572903 RepID=UPI001648D3F3|nr:cytochrome P450 [Streptomyces sp. BK340]